MWSIASNAATAGLRAEALVRCDRARDRVELAIATLGAIDAECVWRSRAVDALREQLKARLDELRELRHRLDDAAATLREG
ncbi:hypothetical protein [uncultured Microbacterium sp.]|uniref:hypothetical protein n=1 Tax=uncultured Microbacterium sp. TaxID=191216 RepID=UPI0025F107C6|nr:hypothetical protein [uncultured Microbacterium sp.]